MACAGEGEEGGAQSSSLCRYHAGDERGRCVVNQCDTTSKNRRVKMQKACSSSSISWLTYMLSFIEILVFIPI